jgi:hypothetical protein
MALTVRTDATSETALSLLADAEAISRQEVFVAPSWSVVSDRVTSPGFKQVRIGWLERSGRTAGVDAGRLRLTDGADNPE